ncbi:MAG: HXXEE domain-containing protein [Candidatus Cryptobacteroides sp.]
MKRFILEYWYYIGAAAGCAALAAAFILKEQIHYLSFLALLNFAVINFHVLEEFRFPGGFPKFCNTMFACKNSPAPERYPLNRLSAILVNWGTALVLYLIPVFFPECIWLGLAPILFGAVAQFIMHAIYNNILLHRLYNAGLGCVLLGHIPIAVAYCSYIVSNSLVHWYDWIVATLVMVLWYVLWCRLAVDRLTYDVNSPYPFSEKEMNRFKA